MTDRKKIQAIERLRGLLELQRKIEIQFGDQGYNIFIFGSYITTVQIVLFRKVGVI